MEEEFEESVCDTCTAGMCEICSERHTSYTYKFKKEEESDYYFNNPIEIKETITSVDKKYNFKIGDTFEYDYSTNPNAYYPVLATVIETFESGDKVRIGYTTRNGRYETEMLE